MLKWIIALLAGLILLLQFKLWVGDGGIPEVIQLRGEKSVLEDEKAKLDERNQALDAEVGDLKTGMDAIEERARSELGMIGKDESFYQVIQPKKDSPDASQAAPK
jgi:cell division protein FtsB